MTMRKNLLFAASVLLSGTVCFAATGDWPQFRGPNHNGTCEKGWFTSLPAAPKALWTAQVGGGCSSLIVSSGKVYGFGNSGHDLLPGYKSESDVVTCLDAETGKEIWKQSYEAPFLIVSDAGGPNATPACDGKCVYTISKLGFVHCFDAEKGTVVWERKLIEDPKVIQGMMYGGVASSPLIVGDALIVSTRDGFVLDRKTGAIKFTFKGISPPWTSPVPVLTNGKAEVVMPKGYGLLFFDPATGNPSREFQTGLFGAGDPLFFDSSVYVSARNGGGGCRVFALSAPNEKPVPVWKSPEDGSYWGNAVRWGDCIFDGQEGGLACLEVKTGTLKWREKSLPHAQPVACDGKLLVMNYNKLMVLDAGPEYKVLATADVLPNKSAPGVSVRFSLAPALTPGRIYCKHSNGDVACVDASGK